MTKLTTRRFNAKMNEADGRVFVGTTPMVENRNKDAFERLKTSVRNANLEETARSIEDLRKELEANPKRLAELCTKVGELAKIHSGTQASAVLGEFSKELESRVTKTKADAKLLKAAKEGNLEEVVAALKAGADVHSRDEFGKTAMIYAMGPDCDVGGLPLQKNEAMVGVLLDAMRESTTERFTV